MPGWVNHILTDPLWVGGATWGAGAITVIGLSLTYWQASKARAAADAAVQATIRTVRELSLRDHLSELGEAGQLTLRIKDYAYDGNPVAVRMALEMLRTRIGSLEATADGDRSTLREHRSLNQIIGVLERHSDEAAMSTSVSLDATMISHQLNDVRRMLSRRAQKLKRLLPEDTNG